MRVRPAGDRGVLVDLPGNAEVHALARVVRARWGRSLEEIVPGDRTLLLTWTGDRPAGLVDELAGIELESVAFSPVTVTIPVRYDGPDLESVAAFAGIDPSELPALHSATTYTAAFIGFAPGFAYLIGGDPRLAIPRRAEPRVRVDAGSVAIAAGYCAVYPTASPGGWHIIGHTDVRLFDLSRHPPALIEPGAQVVFEVA